VAQYLTAPRVQQWLEKTSFPVTDIDLMRESTAAGIVLGGVASRYDTSLWVSEATTPTLVLNLISALYASYTYNAVYSENYGDSDYGRQLWSMVDRLLGNIQSGEIDLPITIVDLSTPGFYPTDTQEYDGMGDERKFTMSVTF
jgi:hypothetical protein